MENTSNQNAAQEKPNQKKQWIEPKIEIINNGYITVGINPGGIEANYAPGGTSPSPADYNFFS